MADSLQSLFKAIAKAENEKQLQQNVIGKVGEYFAAKRYQLFRLVRKLEVSSRTEMVAKLSKPGLSKM